MEIQVFSDRLKYELRDHKINLTDDQFFESLFIQKEDRFVNHEGDFWDYKADWPFSYSDDYFMSLVKLVVAFANNMGGLIIFNVVDSGKKYKKSAVLANSDKFITAIKSVINEYPKIDYREFSGYSMNIPVLIVYPKKSYEIPTNINSWKNKKKRHWFVREGYESVIVSAKKIPTLFCRPQVRAIESSGPIEASLPPSPSTLKHFVTRFDIIEKIFAWVHDPDSPRCFLYGRGGSGKTTIAYEVARYISEYNIEYVRSCMFDVIVFISAKEVHLNTYDGKKNDYQSKDFSNKAEMYKAILILSGYVGEEFDIYNNEDDLLSIVKNLFDSFSVLLIIDDIDTVTTKGLDAGLEELFIVIARAKMGAKILYTLRNAPTYALQNSIEVRGLADEEEISNFVRQCVDQFNVSLPSSDELEHVLRVTEGRPLGIESVMALRRTCKNYTNAIKLFEEHAGDSARSYVFEREWNALSSNQRSHNLLVALALTGRSLNADELQTILKYDEYTIQGVILETIEMFLEVEEGPSGASYSIGEMTRRFVLGQASNLLMFDQIKARVKTFKSRFHNLTPELSKIIMRAEEMYRQFQRDGDRLKFLSCWNIIKNQDISENIKQNPHFMEFSGRFALLIPGVNISEARDYLFDAIGNKHVVDIDVLVSWHRAESNLVSENDMCPRIVQAILTERGYREEDRVKICLIESSRLYHRGKDIRFDSQERAVQFLMDSLLMHMKNIYRADKCNYLGIDRIEGYARNTSLLLFSTMTKHPDVSEFIDSVKKFAECERCFYDPLVQSFSEYGDSLVQRARTKREVGQLISVIGKLEKKCRDEGKWYNSDGMNTLKANLGRLARWLESEIAKGEGLG